MKKVLCLFLFGVSPLGAQAPERPFPSDSAILAIIRQRVDEKRSAGIVIGLLEADGRRRYIAYGDAGPGQPPLDSNSVFEIGSITKVFTGILLAHMSIAGEVKLDDPLRKHLPASANVPRRNGKEITLELLATHRSALPRMPGNFRPGDPANPYADYTAAKMLEFVAAHQLRRDPGEEFEYSNLGVSLLGQALARAGGQPWDELQRERIWRPLGLARTTVALTPWHREHLALGHSPDGKVASLWDLPVETFAPAGAIRSTAADMLTFLAANVRAHEDTGRLAAAMAASHSPRYTIRASAQGGLNWMLRVTPTDTIVWHNGGTGGYRTWAGFVASRRMGVVVLTNSAGAGGDDIGYHLLDSSIPLRASADEETTRTLLWVWIAAIAVLAVSVAITLLWRRRSTPRRARAYPPMQSIDAQGTR